MSEFKEFQGKNLDEAISTACDYFNLNRDKLEIEILSGGSTGVFGLVGKKNAKVKARPRGGDSKPLIEDDSRKGRSRSRRNDDRRPQAPAAEKPVREAVTEPAAAPEEEPAAQKTEVETPTASDAENNIAVREETELAVKPESELAVKEEAQVPAISEEESNTAEHENNSDVDENDSEEEYTERRSIMEGDPEEIAAAVREALELMIEPIIQAKPNLEIEVGEDRVNVLVNDEENSGLIIGREGQTLSSLQYLCNRMVSKKLQTSVRVQIDTGDYRERQDEKLRQLAWHLADKAMHTGRVQSTKPLSSYHRRVVHMALQEDKYVNTRSKGEGPMKRVLILPRRSRGGSGSGRRNDGYQKNDRYNSRSNERPERNDRNRPRRDRNDGFDRNDNYGNRRNDNYGGRRNDNYGGQRNDNYSNRRNDNYGGQRNDNYGNRRNDNYGGQRNDSYGYRRDENFGNRYDDNFGNRQPRQNNRRNDKVKEGGPDGFNSEQYNR
ncbi:RNA-binding cell elongation regulator Jag/EloR [Maridesulfovibrio sp.]|uniref:RNA-binding cell elongation regulator Jag/EloR n=1 Tax=Maridesulfovibrio sp. TaxID=2795000 RepID=UPI002A1880B5|nr:RNA-binding cell elongation regulator Jag/EloR [Maridesulfovibrio sp.]